MKWQWLLLCTRDIIISAIIIIIIAAVSLVWQAIIYGHLPTLHFVVFCIFFHFLAIIIIIIIIIIITWIHTGLNGCIDLYAGYQ